MIVLMIDTTVKTNALINFGHGKLGKVMEKVMGSHGILKSSKSMIPVWWLLIYPEDRIIPDL